MRTGSHIVPPLGLNIYMKQESKFYNNTTFLFLIFYFT